MSTDHDATGDDAFPPDVVAAIRTHMNDDHAEDCLLLVRGPGGQPDAMAAWVTGVDPTGIDLRARVGDGEVQVRIGWSRRLTERREVREELARTIRELRGDDRPSRRRTGRSP